MFFQPHPTHSCLYTPFRENNYASWFSFSQADMHRLRYRCVWMFWGYSWKLPWILCFWLVLNLSPSPFDPKLLAPRAVSASTSGNLDFVCVIGLTGVSFSVLPKRLWCQFGFCPWQIASDSIAPPDPSFMRPSWFPSQTEPGIVAELSVALRNHDYCPVFTSPSALLCVP